LEQEKENHKSGKILSSLPNPIAVLRYTSLWLALRMTMVFYFTPLLVITPYGRDKAPTRAAFIRGPVPNLLAEHQLSKQKKAVKTAFLIFEKENKIYFTSS